MCQFLFQPKRLGISMLRFLVGSMSMWESPKSQEMNLLVTNCCHMKFAVLNNWPSER